MAHAVEGGVCGAAEAADSESGEPKCLPFVGYMFTLFASWEGKSHAVRWPDLCASETDVVVGIASNLRNAFCEFAASVALLDGRKTRVVGYPLVGVVDGDPMVVVSISAEDGKVAYPLSLNGM